MRIRTNIPDFSWRFLWRAFTSLSFVVALLICAPQTFAAEAIAPSSRPENSFAAGLSSFQKGDFAAAQTAFQEALKTDENNPTLLFDYGLTEQKAGKPGLALAMWRKALVIKPDFSQASRAITFQQARLEHPEIPHEVETWESFRQTALVTVSLDTYLLITAILLLVSGGLFLNSVGSKRRARLDERPMPGFPTVAVITGVMCVLGIFLSASKAYDQSIPRGTIVAKQVPALSSPDASATQLFDLYEGLEVIVRQTSSANNESWIQVNYPGGSTGWIPKTAIVTTNDKAVL